ncbi:CU044_5270 family protein [Arthrobacter sp. UYCu712]|uniref:CU044_5270 family protein n=1 Tax=Arthrobacter sp. UYCu712 TaxID=3156340 RepID=UPI00339A1959
MSIIPDPLVPTASDLARNRAQLLQKIATRPERQISDAKNRVPRSSRPRPLVRRTVLLAAAAAVLAGGLVATDAVSLFWRAPATAEAVEALNGAAQQTINTSDPVLGPGQFLKIDTRAVYADEGEGGAGRLYWLESQDRQLYVPADRSGAWVMNFEPARPVTYFGEGTEAAVKEIEARTPKGRTERGDLRRVDAPWSDEELGALPRDPGKLLDTIRDQTGSAGNSADDQALVWISARLRVGTIPADLRATLYRAAALIPGVTLVDRQTTLDGRIGIAIGRVDRSANTRHEIIVDPGNGQFIGERVVDLDGYGAIPPGTATAWTAVKTSVVDTAPTPTP